MDAAASRAAAMRRALSRWLTSALLLASLQSCSTDSVVPDEARIRLAHDLPGKTFYLRHSLFVSPFWSENTRLLLTDGAPDDRPWVLSPTTKEAVPPGAPIAILPAGTRVRIVELELPSAFTMAGRPPISPRFSPWLSLDVEGAAKQPIPTLVLGDVRDYESTMEQLVRWLSPEDIAADLAALPEEQRAAVREKRLVPGMESRAIVMAWGEPERRTLSPSPEGRREAWSWAAGRRTAKLLDGRLEAGFTGALPTLPR